MEDNVLAKQAIKAAMENDWDTAAKLNKKILEENPRDTDALNRLARACGELGNHQKAKECYGDVLKFDPANSIALKNLKLLTKGGNNSTTSGKNGTLQNVKNGHVNGYHKNLSFNIFLTEPGRTKLVSLVNVAPPSILKDLACGEKSELVFKKHQVLIENQNGQYLGAVPDDLSHYLISLVKLGNCYEAYVKAIKANNLTVVIWEKERSARFAHQPSFLTRKQAKAIKSEISDSSLAEVEFDDGFMEVAEA